MPSPIYQFVINLVLSLPIKRSPAVLVNVSVREHRALNNLIFLCGKVYYSKSIIITILMQNLIPSCRFENIFSPNYCIEMS